MPGQQRRRWPNHADTIRTDCLDAAAVAAEKGASAIDRLDQARAASERGGDARLLIADAQREIAEAIAQLEFIQRKLVEAKIGT